MDSLDMDRRRVRPVRESHWKRQLNPAQAGTLRALEQFGWSIRFVRADGALLRATVYDPDRGKLAIIEPDGRLVENPTLLFRS